MEQPTCQIRSSGMRLDQLALSHSPATEPACRCAESPDPARIDSLIEGGWKPLDAKWYSSRVLVACSQPVVVFLLTRR